MGHMTAVEGRLCFKSSSPPRGRVRTTYEREISNCEAVRGPEQLLTRENAFEVGHLEILFLKKWILLRSQIKLAGWGPG